MIVGVAMLAMALNALIAIDFTSGGDAAASSAAIFLDLFRRFIGLLLLVGGMAVVSMRSGQDEALDDRPAPWVLYAVLVGLGLFLLHNLIEFSLFEPSILFVFALLAGSAMGLRTPEKIRARAGSRRKTIAALIVGGVLWLGAAGGLWIPTLLAETHAAEADALVRSAVGVSARAASLGAARLYEQAAREQPLNSAYWFRAALALINAQAPANEVRADLKSAIRRDPFDVVYHRALGEFDGAGPSRAGGPWIRRFRRHWD